MHCSYFDNTRKSNHSATLTPTVVGGRRPFPPKSALEVTHPFEKCRRRPISVYNVSAIRDSEKSSIRTNIKSTMGFPTSTGGVRTISSERVAQKAIFPFFWNKRQLQSNKLSLCENFQRQNCSTAIPLSNGP